MRINKALSFIDKKQNVIIDVGSDHAKLSKLIIDNDLSSRVINIEKNEGPFIQSKNETSKNKYISKIYNIKSDGLSQIGSSLLVDKCFIMGMGGKTIIEIISGYKFNNIKEFILQPNNNESSIREWAKKNKWKIKNEDLIKEKGIIYEFIILSKEDGYKPRFKNDLIFGRINIKNKNKLFIEKWKSFISHNLDKSKLNKNIKTICKKAKRIINDK